MQTLQWDPPTRNINNRPQPQVNGQSVTVTCTTGPVVSRTNRRSGSLETNADSGPALKVQGLQLRMRFAQRLTRIAVQCGAIPLGAPSAIADVSITTNAVGVQAHSQVNTTDTCLAPFLPSLICSALPGASFDQIDITVTTRTGETEVVVGTVLIQTVNFAPPPALPLAELVADIAPQQPPATGGAAPAKSPKRPRKSASKRASKTE